MSEMSECIIRGQIYSTGYDSISPLGPNPEALKVGHLILLNQNFTLRMPLVIQTSTTTTNMSSTANMLLNELHALQEWQKKEDKELQQCMEDVRTQLSESKYTQWHVAS